MGGETVEDENMWYTNEGGTFTTEILDKFLHGSVSLELRYFPRTLEARS